MVITPIPLGTSAQDWARLFNVNASIADYHNHTLGNTLNINSIFLGSGDLNVNNQNIINLSVLQFSVNSFPDQVHSLFVNDTFDLCYMDEDYILPITSGLGLNIVDQPEGFTVIGAPPVAIFDPSLNTLKFLDAAGNNAATLLVETLNCAHMKSGGTVSMTNMEINPTLQSLVDKSKFFGVDITLPVITYRTFETTFRAYQTADLYKVSENGVFYYDNVLFNPTSGPIYDVSYWLGAKTLALSNSTSKTNKQARKYYTEYVDFPIGLVTRETFTIVTDTSNKRLVSLCPKIMTSGTQKLGLVSQNLNQVSFNIIVNTDSIQVAVDLDLNPLKGYIGTTATLRFIVIYVDPTFAIKDD